LVANNGLKDQLEREVCVWRVVVVDLLVREVGVEVAEGLL
jgi:hypothetical protein